MANISGIDKSNTDRSSNAIWKDGWNPNIWELRKHRFTDEMRPVFFHYLGINKDSYVLDGGCGTGVFTRYLAHGLDSGRGKIVGFDISEKLVEYGREMLAKETLTGKAEFCIEDGFELSFGDDTFDAVTNYTYLGVLSDPVKGLEELIRVCRKGGTVSSVIATNRIPRIRWQGDYPFEWNTRLHELYEKQESIYQKHVNKPSRLHQSDVWDAFRYPRLFGEFKLKDIHVYPFGIGIAYNDRRFPREYVRKIVDIELNDEINWISGRKEQDLKTFEAHGFTVADFSELIDLLSKKRRYLLENFESDNSWEWEMGLNFIVAGTK